MELANTSFNVKTEVCGANVSKSARCYFLVKKVPLVKVQLKWTQRQGILHDTCLILVWLSQGLFFVMLVFRIIITEAIYTEDFRRFYQSLQGFISIDLQNNRHMFNFFCKISNSMPLYLTCKWSSNSINASNNVYFVTKQQL